MTKAQIKKVGITSGITAIVAALAYFGIVETGVLETVMTFFGGTGA